MALIDDGNRRWWVLLSSAFTFGLMVLDETIVGVALVTIRSELGLSVVVSHWVVNVYLLTFTSFVAVGGKLVDELGQTRMLTVGLAIFGLSSLAAGFSESGGILIAARGLQGVGAGIIVPASMAIGTALFSSGDRGLALGVQVTIAAVFMSSGPLLGGYFSEVVSWRWIFWVNLPVIAVIIAVIHSAWVPPKPAHGGDEAEARFILDMRGFVLLVAGLGAFVGGVMQGADWGWSSPATLGLVLSGLVLLSAFTFAELKTNAPLVDLELLRITAFSASCSAFFMFQFGKMVVFVFLALYLQQVLGLSPLNAGLVIVLAVLPSLGVSYIAGKCADRFGSRPPLLIAMLASGFALAGIGISTWMDRLAPIVVFLLIWGASMPFYAIAGRRTVLNAVPLEGRGKATGVNFTIQLLGGTIGVAIASAIHSETGGFTMMFLVTSGLTLAALFPVAACVKAEKHAPQAAA
ncbi:MFS transporter [Stappia sp. GBMRC 2046]|uniref:MFS transporter n=1 Tax=Stappia sediminis TaxID=2692190 RepID=A0A7X3LSW4_9HYPH|nr:MFS transporter [Stappia sediminis]MXN64481.1 MFS transporter [Stappia sediminis]